jgi:hypothetical protein
VLQPSDDRFQVHALGDVDQPVTGDVRERGGQPLPAERPGAVEQGLVHAQREDHTDPVLSSISS